MPFSIHLRVFFFSIESIPTTDPAKPNPVYLTEADPGQVKSTESSIACYCKAKQTNQAKQNKPGKAKHNKQTKANQNQKRNQTKQIKSK